MEKGTYGVLLTPFDAKGNVDLDLFRNELNHCLDTDLTGLMISGSTGEFPYLSTQENKSLLREAMTTAGGQKELIAGISGARESEVLENIFSAEEFGYTLAMACPPYYFPQDDTSVYDFYCFVSESLPHSMNLVLYNIPFCAPAVSVDNFIRLIEKPNIVGIKDSSGDMLYFEKLVAISNTERPDFSVFTGQDTTILPAVATGGSGLISSGAWMLDDVIQHLLKFLHKGQFDEARKLQHWITDLMLHVNQIPFPENYRALAACLGTDCGIPQRKLSSLRKEHYAEWTEITRRKLDLVPTIVD
ncbi:MAG: dihydrodipicolinate synthase family protein [Sphaerochaetaceae bacterium]